MVNAPLDKNIKPLSINLADPVYLFEDDKVTELFRGFITEREASSVTGVVTYVAYDLLFYTLKSNATYNFSGKTAETITQMVCDDMEIPVGNLASTGLSQKLIVQNVSIYEIIMRAYTQAYQQNGVSYRVTAKKGCLNVEEMTVGIQPRAIAIDRNGKLWAMTDGGYAGSPYGHEPPALFRIDPESMTTELFFPCCFSFIRAIALSAGSPCRIKYPTAN